MKRTVALVLLLLVASLVSAQILYQSDKSKPSKMYGGTGWPQGIYLSYGAGSNTLTAEKDFTEFFGEDITKQAFDILNKAEAGQQPENTWYFLPQKEGGHIIYILLDDLSVIVFMRTPEVATLHYYKRVIDLDAPLPPGALPQTMDDIKRNAWRWVELKRAESK